MAKGRKPIPSKLKALRGCPDKRPLNRSEPKPREGVPECPPHLSDEAKAEWFRIVPELRGCGLLTMVDRAALAGYCQAWGRWVAAETEITKTAEVVLTAKKNAIQNPWLSIANRALEQMSKFLVEFGMSPSSRTRIHAPGGEKKDRLEEFISLKQTGAKTG